MNPDDNEIRTILREMLSDKRKLLIMSQSLKSVYEKREKEIQTSQGMLQSDLRKLVEEKVPSAAPLFRLHENMTTIYAAFNKEIRFLQLLIESVALNNIEQPEPERIDPSLILSGEDKKVLEWIKKYMEHKPEEDKF